VTPVRGVDATSPVQPTDGGRVPVDGEPPVQDGGPDATTQHGSDGGITYIDAGYYRGDGSFFVDAAVYPDVGSPRDAPMTTDAVAVDGGLVAACATLAACCPSLQGGSQSLCASTALADSATNCSAEQAQLAAVGDCTGVSVLASQVQATPTWLVSDGTTLFWTTGATPALLAMPVEGGAVTVLLEGPITNNPIPNRVDCSACAFLGVDDVNVYILESNSLVRIPKNGAAATLVNEPGAGVVAATTLGGIAYWLENADGHNYGEPRSKVAVKSAPLLGGARSSIANLASPDLPPSDLAVTATSVFFGVETVELFEFPMSGVSAGGATQVTPGGPMFMTCTSITSDTNSIYCAESDGFNLVIANDGTATSLGPAATSSYIVFDDTYAYWADMTTVGTIMKAPKAGGGTATVIARDTSPTAIAVDATSVYWGDENGYIKSVAK
jgi:hypothetical protein